MKINLYIVFHLIVVIITVDESMPYILYENEGSVNIVLLLDQPSCHPIAINANPKERSPPSATGNMSKPYASHI